ncbi:Synaptotagmin-2 [Fasciola gigantica]|uniref:Synaptotagmin-2 n=1 Tax=Fasciola gigantica TaxID=46835 RepID=A0A504YAQ0_FASGI|nr:Synaptotagmin-2 [Fasciola gigantica]
MAPANRTLEDVPFLRNLAATFNVKNIPLAIFLLILVCIACVTAAIIIILCIRSCLRRVYKTKPKRKPLKTAYLEDILDPVIEPGMCGLLTYALEYELTNKCFRVVVVEAKNLSSPNETKLHDAYASVRLLIRSGPKWIPHGPRYKTDVQRNTSVPRWHYSCNYTITETELKNSMLIIEVFDYDSLGQDRSVGRVEVTIGEIDMGEYLGATFEKTVALKPGSPKYRGIGEICVGLAYLTNPGCMEIFIYEIRRLDIGHAIAPGKDVISVQVELKHKKRTLGTFETKSRIDTINPYFNEKTMFNIKPKLLDEASVVCSLKKRSTLGRRTILAQAIIGPQSPLNTGTKQWDEMRSHSPRTHVMWHVLVPHGVKLDEINVN